MNKITPKKNKILIKIAIIFSLLLFIFYFIYYFSKKIQQSNHRENEINQEIKNENNIDFFDNSLDKERLPYYNDLFFQNETIQLYSLLCSVLVGILVICLIFSFSRCKYNKNGDITDLNVFLGFLFTKEQKQYIGSYKFNQRGFRGILEQHVKTDHPLSSGGTKVVLTIFSSRLAPIFLFFFSLMEFFIIPTLICLLRKNFSFFESLKKSFKNKFYFRNLKKSLITIFSIILTVILLFLYIYHGSFTGDAIEKIIEKTQEVDAAKREKSIFNHDNINKLFENLRKKIKKGKKSDNNEELNDNKSNPNSNENLNENSNNNNLNNDNSNNDNQESNEI